MVRSRSIFSQNKLTLFLLISLCVHGVLFVGLKTDFLKDRRIEKISYTVRLKSISQAVPEPLVPEETPVPAQETLPAEAVSSGPVPLEIPETTEQTGAELHKEAQEEAPPVPAEDSSVLSEEQTQPFVLGKIGTVSVEQSSADGPVTSSVSGSAEFVRYDSLVPGARVPKPDYPDLAQRWGHEGTVVLEIQISADGSVTETKVLKSSGFEELDNAARQVVLKRWKFRDQGKAVTTKKEFEFKLRR